MRDVFTPEQRAQLLELGVLVEQIVRLEAEIPMCRAILVKRPKMADVRTELDSFEGALATADRALLRMTAPSDQGYVTEAQIRLQLASHDAREALPKDAPCDMRELHRALDALSVALVLARHARASLTESKVAHRTATPEIVARLQLALRNGWGDVYSKAHDVGDQPNDVIEFQPSPFAVSNDPGSLFRRVMAVCYEAITGKRDADPERAIRGFIAQEKSSLRPPVKRRTKRSDSSP